ncbi:unnamed protein product [Paramecium pentaurelia]|uniref:Uncharacterized protein n=1 Tax=Paramecium pentaurelia TaxID=43138 RepID=A0A8S1T8W2_9CILI|nr:unnamed protein product [Paramecium pentaurelia]
MVRDSSVYLYKDVFGLSTNTVILIQSEYELFNSIQGFYQSVMLDIKIQQQKIILKKRFEQQNLFIEKLLEQDEKLQIIENNKQFKFKMLVDQILLNLRVVLIGQQMNLKSSNFALFQTIEIIQGIRYMIVFQVSLNKIKMLQFHQGSFNQSRKHSEQIKGLLI